MNELPRIQEVKVTGPASIQIAWLDGAMSSIDLAGWVGLGNRHLTPLTDPATFARARIGAFGGNVTWDDDEGDLAIDAYHLSLIAEQQAPFKAEDAAAWQSALALSNAEVAELLGISETSWSNYKRGGEIPTTVARLCRAVRRDPIILYAHLRPKASEQASFGDFQP